MVKANLKIINELKMFLDDISKDEGLRKLSTNGEHDFSRNRKLPLALGRWHHHQHAEKGELWKGIVEAYYGSSVSGPVVAGNSFALSMSLGITMKEGGRTSITELCLYKLKDGKIISEEFIM